MKSSTLAALTLALLAATACGGEPPLQAAYDECHKVGEVDGAPVDMVSLASDQKSLTIDSGGGGEISASIGMLTAQCFLNELEAPSGVSSKMESTSAMMGRQEEEWGDLSVSWSYHPDNGLNAVFEDAS